MVTIHSSPERSLGVSQFSSQNTKYLLVSASKTWEFDAKWLQSEHLWVLDCSLVKTSHLNTSLTSALSNLNGHNKMRKLSTDLQINKLGAALFEKMIFQFNFKQNLKNQRYQCFWTESVGSVWRVFSKRKCEIHIIQIIRLDDVNVWTCVRPDDRPT